jgi:tetratricopeptide (TPR) repeat protein
MQEPTAPSWQHDEPSSTGPIIPRGEVEAELQRILASPIFRKAPRHSRFLSFVTRKALDASGDCIKEYLIGVEVFDRESDYDPGSDPVVRVEAGRLRSRLTAYYRKDGRLDPIHIELPKGTYAPVFQRNGIAPIEDAVPALRDGAGDVLIVPDTGPLEAASPKRKGRRIWAPALLLAFCLVAGYGAHRWRRSQAIASALANAPLVVADFTNTTGDAVFDDSLRQGLSSQLEQSPYLNLLSDRRIQQTLSLMAQPKDVRLTHQLAREACLRTAGAAVLEGSISMRGSQYALGLKAVSCDDGAPLTYVEITAARRDQVLKALGEAATNLRRKLGEPLVSVRQYDVPLESVTTSSLEALQAYTLGLRAKNVWGDFATAVPLLQRATSLDPNFAIAYSALGTIYPGSDGVAEEYLRKAYELRDRASLREQFYIDSHYHHLVTGDREAAKRVYELWNQTYPQDAAPISNLGQIYGVLGNHGKALTAFQNAVKLEPGNGLMQANLVLGYMEVNRLDEAQATAREAQAHNLDPPLIHLDLYFIDILQHDAAGMEQEPIGLMNKPGWEARMLGVEASTAAQGGQFVRSRNFTRRAVDFAVMANDKEAAAYYQSVAAVHEALVGNVDAAQRGLRAAQALSNKEYVNHAMVLALTGDFARAMQLVQSLNKQQPKDTVLQFNQLPAIRAAIALKQGDPAKAIEVLAPIAPYELGDGAYIPLYGVYLRGNAYLAQRQGVAAAAEFQKILDHPGVVLNEPIGALAHLGLGRAYVLSGDKVKARAAYQDFFAIWKDADPDIPIYKQAKAEYAKLK